MVAVRTAGKGGRGVEKNGKPEDLDADVMRVRNRKVTIRGEKMLKRKSKSLGCLVRRTRKEIKMKGVQKGR